MKRNIIVVVALLYAITWIGGWYAHSREIKLRAQQMYADAERRDREMAALYQKEGLGTYNASEELKYGSSSGVNWCVPLLPGVLLADSWYVNGPLWGKGGVKIVLYYGFGSKELVCVWGWIS